MAGPILVGAAWLFYDDLKSGVDPLIGTDSPIAQGDGTKEAGENAGDGNEGGADDGTDNAASERDAERRQEEAQAVLS